MVLEEWVAMVLEEWAAMVLEEHPKNGAMQPSQPPWLTSAVTAPSPPLQQFFLAPSHGFQAVLLVLLAMHDFMMLSSCTHYLLLTTISGDVQVTRSVQVTFICTCVCECVCVCMC